jgi:hypothetical protein
MFLLTAAGLIPGCALRRQSCPRGGFHERDNRATRCDNSIRHSPIHNLKLIIYQP